MIGRSLLGDTLLWWADIYCGTHCYGGQIFIGGHIFRMGRSLLGNILF